MAKSKKVYTVGIGYVEYYKNETPSSKDFPEFSSETLVAEDAEKAIHAVKRGLTKNQYIASVTIADVLTM